MANALDVTTDYLMNGSVADLAHENITDKALSNQFNDISGLSEDSKTAVSKLIAAFYFSKR